MLGLPEGGCVEGQRSGEGEWEEGEVIRNKRMKWYSRALNGARPTAGMRARTHEWMDHGAAAKGRPRFIFEPDVT